MKRQMIALDQTQKLSRVDYIFVLCGIVAPIIWFLAILIAGILRPEYSHVSQAISILGSRDTPFSMVYNYIGLMPTGILTFAFSLAMFRCLKNKLVFYISSSFVAIMGIARFLAGVFPCDPGCYPVITLSGRIHMLTGMMAMFAGMIAPLVMTIGLRNKKSRNLFYLSMILGVASLIIFMLIISQLFIPSIGAYIGALQRSLLILTYSWIIAVAVNLKNMKFETACLKKD